MSIQLSEDERVLAALSHASVVANVFNLAGMIATALIWTMHRDRSPYVRAHALQALVYQGAVLLITLFLALFGGLCLALSLLPAMLRPDLYRGSPPSYSVWIGVLALLALIGFGVLATLYGLYAAYQVYRGRSFRYPLDWPAGAPAAEPHARGRPDRACARSCASRTFAAGGRPARWSRRSPRRYRRSRPLVLFRQPCPSGAAAGRPVTGMRKLSECVSS